MDVLLRHGEGGAQNLSYFHGSLSQLLSILFRQLVFVGLIVIVIAVAIVIDITIVRCERFHSFVRHFDARLTQARFQSGVPYYQRRLLGYRMTAAKITWMTDGDLATNLRGRHVNRCAGPVRPAICLGVDPLLPQTA